MNHEPAASLASSASTTLCGHDTVRAEEEVARGSRSVKVCQEPKEEGAGGRWAGVKRHIYLNGHSNMQSCKVPAADISVAKKGSGEEATMIMGEESGGGARP